MNKWRLSVLVLIIAIIASGAAFGARVSDVRGTRHNFSNVTDGTATPSGGAVPARIVKASTETQVCVFCHTPHAATDGVKPLWNRKLSTTATYTPYTSGSLDAEAIQGALSNQANGSSKLCLSCHDGAMAIGNVNVLNGSGSTTPGTVSITMQATAGAGAGGIMPSGSGDATGFTRKLGTNLTNDHPISVTYNSTLVDRDGELRTVDASQKYPATTGTIIGVRSSGYKPKLPLEPTGTSGAGQIQCATCHDPHLRETDEATVGNQKFLRLNRFQSSASSNAVTGTYSQTDDIICLACHTKSGTTGTDNTSWAYSAHANKQVATQTYTAGAATLRDFPSALPVWQASCLNCHDTHTVQGSRRLLREGTNPGTASPKAGGAGTSAIEETCYQCHDGSTTVLSSVNTAGKIVPNIKTDFGLTIHMPIENTTELHEIGGNFTIGTDGYNECASTTNKCGKDFVESRDKLGLTLANRHVECTDCHNPHRVVKFKDFRGNPAGTISSAPDASGTHPHLTASSTPAHTNIASGVLRGSWGVEPTYGSESFHVSPNGFNVKRGDASGATTAAVGDAWVTREYQVCMKCHSNFGFSDASPPSLGGTGGTPNNTNNLTKYTNQGKEFQAPSAHRGQVSQGNAAGSADCTSLPCRFNTNNHRSWHPVMDVTGRDSTARGGALTTNWNHPFRTIGSQTMYCSDCHGSQVTSTSSVVPDKTAVGTPPPWGPHGSTNNFLLKGVWNNTIVQTDSALLCYKCHLRTTYAGSSEQQTGFQTDKGDGHTVHRNKINGKVGGSDTNNTFKCSYCHVAVPHGWKNKALLVNLNDVGEEAGQGAGSSKEVALSSTDTDTYNKEPYYMNAKLKIRTFATSGNWTASNCGSVNKTGTGLTNGIINGSGGATNNTQTGLTWMQETCKNPP